MKDINTVKVDAIMDKEVMAISVSKDEKVPGITAQFNKYNISSALIIDYQKDQIAGIITERDLVRGLNKYGEDVVKMSAKDLGTMVPIKSVDPEDVVKMSASDLGTMGPVKSV